MNINQDQATMFIPQQKSIHENSKESYREEIGKGHSKTFRFRIWKILYLTKLPLTDREIMAFLSESDVNNVRPEITRLKNDGLINEFDKIKCKITGKTVRRVIICSDQYSERKIVKDRFSI